MLEEFVYVSPRCLRRKPAQNNGGFLLLMLQCWILFPVFFVVRITLIVLLKSSFTSFQLESSYSKLLKKHSDALEEINILVAKVNEMTEAETNRSEECNVLRKSDQLKNIEINRLKREISALRKQQKNNEEGESDMIKLLKEQV